MLAALALAERGGAESGAEAQRHVRAAVEAVASTLGNTPAICRKCYIHPEIVAGYLDGKLGPEAISPAEPGGQGGAGQLVAAEGAVLAFLRLRLPASKAHQA